MQITLVSYNIHAALGTDKRFSIERIAQVISECDADIVALQEVDERKKRPHEASVLDTLAEMTSMQAIRGVTIDSTEGQYGNAVLTRLPVRAVRMHNLSYKQKEPRGAIDTVIELSKGNSLRVIATHLGLGFRERIYQFQQLKLILQNKFESLEHSSYSDQIHPATDLSPRIPAMARNKQATQNETICLLGDFNEWLFYSPQFRVFQKMGMVSQTRRTFPTYLPVFPLDRIFVAPARVFQSISVHRSPLSRIASDHLPIIAKLAMPDDP